MIFFTCQYLDLTFHNLSFNSPQAELADCSFKPKRTGSKVSDQLLRKMGREKVSPEDLFKYEAEKQRRIEVRKNIVTEIEDKELTFKPQLGEKSIKLQVCMFP